MNWLNCKRLQTVTLYFIINCCSYFLSHLRPIYPFGMLYFHMYVLSLSVILFGALGGLAVVNVAFCWESSLIFLFLELYMNRHIYGSFYYENDYFCHDSYEEESGPSVQLDPFGDIGTCWLFYVIMTLPGHLQYHFLHLNECCGIYCSGLSL